MKYHGIQTLRGFAALAVVFHHLDVLLAKPKYFGESFLGPIAVSGFRGVDLFFVISGFIMMYTSHSNPNRTRLDFARNRVMRIFVPYLPVFLALTAVYMAAPGIAQGGIEIDVGYWVQNLLLLPRQSLETYVPVVAWTLTFELTFYIIFAITIFRSGRLAEIAFCAWMAACVLNVWVGIPVMVLAPLNLGFGIGVLSYLVSQRIPDTMKFSGFIISSGVFLILMVYGGERFENAFINFAFLLVSGIMCATSTGIPRNVVSRVGDFSYSLYLCHYPLLAFLFIVTFKFGVADALGPVGITLISVAVALASSWAYYLVIEISLYGKLKRQIRSPRQSLSRGK